MKDINVQTEYWDGAAGRKTFTHPIPMSVFHELLSPAANILDYGCGYGRSCSELIEAGYHNVCGIDISEEMIKRGRHQNGSLDLRTFDGKSANFDDGWFDVCILMAVLTCIPSDAGQEAAIAEINRLLRPGGIALISDYPLQTDARNLKRYKEFEKDFGAFGTFRTEEAIVRHHDMEWIYQLISRFEVLWEQKVRVRTMNGNESDVFQIIVRK